MHVKANKTNLIINFGLSVFFIIIFRREQRLLSITSILREKRLKYNTATGICLHRSYLQLHQPGYACTEDICHL